MRLALTVLARAPEPGLVKTRLAAAVGAAAACEVHVALATDTLAALGPQRLTLPERGHVLALTGGAAAAERLAGPARDAGWRIEEQAEGDLGARMAAAVARRLAEGFEGALIAGTDAPLLGAGVVEAAGALLAEHDAALVPAGDGGYVLLGARRDLAAALAGIPWGTADALEATLAGLEREGFMARVAFGEEDVDDLQGLLRLERRLLALPGACPATAAWLRRARAEDASRRAGVDASERGPLPPLR